ncbi:Chymosin [Grifola frondosa]|uniref:Chymosin n=1 Tax=Grifola frondosa TaxID=5627 RepID=A0A1C7M4F3_GRIFR|nr:Chymosin [Grifola frondosa]
MSWSHPYIPFTLFRFEVPYLLASWRQIVTLSPHLLRSFSLLDSTATEVVPLPLDCVRMRLSTSAPSARARAGKGKERAIRSEGAGGNDGIVLPLDMVQSSTFQAVYTIPILVGSDQQNLSVQVDTGSSDLWLASTSCSSSPCHQVGGHLYDPTHSTPTPQAVSITYAEGDVSGPIVWDTVVLGGYSVDDQALAAASVVNNEPLTSDFNGVLGLALPLNSFISEQIPPVTGNTPDGASFSSNLFSITPASTAPGARFFSLSLARPGSDRVPSLLGIGRHPEQLVPDPSKIQYSALVTENVGALWWQASVRAITVYVDSQPNVVQLPQSNSGSVYPSAVLDSGMPVILATQAIANGIYGALGISPSSTGQYFVPCTTPLNMTITLDDRTEIPLHPLDLTYYPPSGATSSMCIGIIQSTSDMNDPALALTDMVLGVPFMRNTYTVMAYDPPDSNGNFPTNSENESDLTSKVRPRLGLLNLTDPVVALEEFHTVRVLNQPLTSAQGNAATTPTSGKHLSVGVEVLFGLIGFFALCFVLFGARWAYMRHKYARERMRGGLENSDQKGGSILMTDIPYHLAARESESDVPSEDTLRAMRYEEYKRRTQNSSAYTDDTARTCVPSDAYGEFGYKDKKRGDSPERSYYDSLVAGDPIEDAHTPEPSPTVPRRADYSPAISHHRTLSGAPSVSLPLLAHTRSGSQTEDVTDFGMGFTADLDRPVSMAGVGTAARGRHFSMGSRQSSRGSVGSILSPPRSPMLLLLSPDGSSQGPEPAFAAADADKSASFVAINGHES